MDSPRSAAPNELMSRPTPRQLNLTFDTAALQGMTALQRREAVLRLANLLAEAAGIPIARESSNDER